MTDKEKIRRYNELEKYIHEHLNLDFDFEVEHWENGSYDDSFEYGVECGLQETLSVLLPLVSKEVA